MGVIRCRRIYAQVGICQSSSCCNVGWARSSSRVTLGAVSSACARSPGRRACSPRTSALPRGIITALSQRQQRECAAEGMKPPPFLFELLIRRNCHNPDTCWVTNSTSGTGIAPGYTAYYYVIINNLGNFLRCRGF